MANGNLIMKKTLKSVYIGSYRLLPIKRLSPSFIICGAMKSGTTFLFEAITQSRDIISPVKKEVHYFDSNYDQPTEWYMGHFPCARWSGFHTGEATPAYMFMPAVPERIHEELPSVELVFILRNPVFRAISHYYHEVRLGREEKGLMNALRSEEERLERGNGFNSFEYQHYSYKKRGKYSEQLKRFLETFERSQIHILISEEMFKRPVETINSLLDRFGVAPISDTVGVQSSGSSYNVPAEAVEYLKGVFREELDTLSNLLETSIPW
jgi:hypothetical protein